MRPDKASNIQGLTHIQTQHNPIVSSLQSMPCYSFHRLLMFSLDCLQVIAAFCVLCHNSRVAGQSRKNNGVITYILVTVGFLVIYTQLELHTQTFFSFSPFPSPLSSSRIGHSCLSVLPLLLNKKYSVACIVASR